MRELGPFSAHLYKNSYEKFLQIPPNSRIRALIEKYTWQRCRSFKTEMPRLAE